MMFPAEGIEVMGFSVRSDALRYTEWRRWVNSSLPLRADWSEAGLMGKELYPHVHDPSLGPSDFDSSENVNVADDSAYSGAMAALARVLRQQFHPSST
jgi:hypothetical protein